MSLLGESTPEISTYGVFAMDKWQLFAESLNKRAKRITIEVRSSYGVDHVYPADGMGSFGDMITQLMGTKTLTPYAMATLAKHGYTFHTAASFEIKPEDLNR